MTKQARYLPNSTNQSGGRSSTEDLAKLVSEARPILIAPWTKVNQQQHRQQFGTLRFFDEMRPTQARFGGGGGPIGKYSM